MQLCGQLQPLSRPHKHTNMHNIEMCYSHTDCIEKMLLSCRTQRVFFHKGGGQTPAASQRKINAQINIFVYALRTRSRFICNVSN